MSKKNKYWEAPLIGGISGVFLSLFLTQDYYTKYIVNVSNNPAGDAKGKGFYLILHFISNYIGKIGLQILFGVIALICFYVAYKLYKKQKKQKHDWEDYKESRC